MAVKKGTEGLSKEVYNFMSPFEAFNSKNIWAVSETDYQTLNIEGQNMNFKGIKVDSASESDFENEAFQMEIDDMLDEIDKFRENANLKQQNSKIDNFQSKTDILNPNAEAFQARNSPTL